MGPTSRHVAKNIKRIRSEAGIDLRKLSTLLTDLKRPISPSGLSKIENDERRVDVDELMVIAQALKTSPLNILVPVETNEPVATGVEEDVNPDELYEWIRNDLKHLDAESRQAFWVRKYKQWSRELEAIKESAIPDWLEDVLEHNVRIYERRLSIASNRIETLKKQTGKDVLVVGEAQPFFDPIDHMTAEADE